jgi:thioredoxin-related protein
VVALGARDSLNDAKAFAARHKTTTPRMLWAPTFDAWSYYGVPSQPAFVLVDATGNNVLGASPGQIPYEKILKLIAG